MRFDLDLLKCIILHNFVMGFELRMIILSTNIHAISPNNLKQIQYIFLSFGSTSSASCLFSFLGQKNFVFYPYAMVFVSVRLHDGVNLIFSKNNSFWHTCNWVYYCLEICIPQSDQVRQVCQNVWKALSLKI
jgi:hypothetical protein